MKTKNLLAIFALLCSAPFLSAQNASPDTKSEKDKLLDPKAAADDTAPLKLDPKGDLPSAVAPGDGEEKNEPLQEELLAAEGFSKEDVATISSDLNDAAKYMSTQRSVEALERLNNVDRVAGRPVHLAENLRGAIYTRMRDFENARKHFTKAAELEKTSFHPRFNLAEIDFVEKKYDSAKTSFSALIAEMKKAAEEEKDPLKKKVKENDYKITGALMRFKVLICELQTKNAEGSKKLLGEFSKFDDLTPAYYYANAARAFADEKKEEAEDWMNSAKTIYAPALCEIYLDSFVEMGWLSSLQ